MPRKKAEPQPPSFRDDLFQYCTSCLPENQKHITVKRYAKNDMIELKRYEAFFRLYISDTGLRASIRMNTLNCDWRVNDAPLFEPSPERLKKYEESSSKDKDRFAMEFWEVLNLSLAETFDALNEIQYTWERQTRIERWMREDWLYEWIPAVMMPPGQRTAVRLKLEARLLGNIAYSAKRDSIDEDGSLDKLASYAEEVAEFFSGLYI